MFNHFRNKMLDSNCKCLVYIGRAMYYVSHTKLVDFFRFKGYLSDEKYIRYVYKKTFMTEPNISFPINFNEKNNWRKLFDRNSIYTSMVDKFQIKELIQKRVGAGYTFPLLGVWDNPEQIDFSSLPEQFVLKVNHAGGVIVCRDKDTLDIDSVLFELKADLMINYFIRSREWPYKNVKRKIICEAYMGENLIDYKNYCFDGHLLYTFVWRNVSRSDGRKPDTLFCGAYDTDWNRTNLRLEYPSSTEIVEKPVCYNEMKRIAEVMSKDIPFVRVDCYVVNDKPYIGEMTFFPWGGFMRFSNNEWNDALGELEHLPEIQNNYL